MVTIIFVEGKTDVYFFQSALTILKNSQIVTPYDCRNASTQYYAYRRKEKIIVRSESKYAILIGCNGKHGAINTFIESIKEFLRRDNPVVKLFLVIDQDYPGKFEKKMVDELQSLTNEFPHENISLTSFQKTNALYKATISRRTKKIQLGFTEVKPNLEAIISTLLRDYSTIPNDHLVGGEHEIIRNACKYLQINGIEELCSYLIEHYKDQLKLKITQNELTHSICYMLSSNCSTYP